MFKLIRDKIPEMAKKEKQILNYATAENDELYIILLKNVLIEEVQEFLNTGNLQKLADAETVIDAIVKAGKLSPEEFKKLSDTTVEQVGGFEKRYIGFFPDPAPQPEPAPADSDITITPTADETK